MADIPPFAASPVPGGLTIPGATQGAQYLAPPDPQYAASEQVWSNLSQRIGAMADSVAQQEGTRAGKIAAIDPNFQPPEGAQVSTYGKAYQQAATAGYVNKLDQTARDAATKVQNDFDALPQAQQTPEEMQKRLDASKATLIQQHVIPEVQGAFGNTWDTTARSMVAQAKKANDSYVQSDAKAASVSNIASSQAQMARQAQIPGPVSDKALQAQENDFNTTIDGLVADGTYTPVQAGKIKDTQHQLNLQNKVTAQVNALPAADRPGFLVKLQADWAAGAGAPEAGGAIAVPGYDGKFTRAQAEAASDDDEKTPGTTEWDAAAKAHPPVKPADGKGGLTAGWSADTYDTVVGAMQTQIRQDATQQKQASRTDVKALSDLTDNLVKGNAVPPAAVAALNTKYATSADPDTAAALDLFNKTNALMKGMKGKPPEQLEAEANAEAQVAGQQGASPTQIALTQTKTDYAANLRSDLAKDPLGRATRDGMVQAPAPLDFSNPANLAASLKARIPTAQVVGENYRMKTPAYFLPAELDQLKTIATQGGPQALQMATAIAQAGGSQTGAILKQLGDTGEAFTHLAKLNTPALGGGDVQLQRDAMQTQQLQNTAAGRAELPQIKKSNIDAQAQEVYGDAFRGMPIFGGGAAMTATQAYQAQALRDQTLDRDLSSNKSRQTFNDTLQRAAGATFSNGTQYGGVADYAPGWFSGGGVAQKVPIPPDMKASEFTNVVKSIDDKTLQNLPAPPVGGDGRPVTAQQIQNSGTFVALSHGRYQVYLGDPNSRDPKTVMTPQGHEFVLDLNQMAPTLRYKHPEAYR
jgi:hypothetical protein